MVIFNAAGSVFSIVIMICVGYILTAKKWFDESVSKLFSMLVCNIALPCLMISDLVGNFDREKLSNLSSGLIVPFASMAICYVIGVILSKIIKVERKRIGTFRSMFFVSNSIFIGLPINMALFGEFSIPYVLLYYIANTTFFWTLGAYGISKDGDNNNSRIISKETFVRLVSPPLMGFIIGMILISLNIQLPKFILDTCKYLGNLTTPLSMLFIGIIIYSVDLKKIKFSMEMAVILVGRFFISPILIYFAAKYMHIPVLMEKVFIIQAAMPVMTNTSIVAKQYNADYEYAAVMTVVTTICILIFIPIYMYLIN
ncbi:MAG: AEC family transporter [Clostridium sp.]|uniref:AEC family transporter n=1 Tax=Clostridium sp. TaxID=1506 RepID=UPI0025C1EFA1|nr:AEC family transporter [Clostridium sp.]MCE5222045.1 AEC family transporter [Clostridium sp.]